MDTLRAMIWVSQCIEPTQPCEGWVFHTSMTPIILWLPTKDPTGRPTHQRSLPADAGVSNSQPYSIVVEDNSETGYSILKISMDQGAPDEMLLTVGDAIHDLRSSLTSR